MTTVAVQLKTGEVLRDLPLSDAGDLVSAGKGTIIETTTTTSTMIPGVTIVVDVPAESVVDVPLTVTAAPPKPQTPVVRGGKTSTRKSGRTR